MGFSFRIALLGCFVLLCFTGCSTMPFTKVNRAPSQYFITNFNVAWTAALDAMKALGPDIVKDSNRDLGTIETGWVDNTNQKLFLEVFANEHFFLRARYRMQVQVRGGMKNGTPVVLVRVLKEQQVEDTFLAGMQPAESTGVEEATFLYRMGRLIAVQDYLDRIEMDAKNVSKNIASQYPADQD